MKTEIHPFLALFVRSGLIFSLKCLVLLTGLSSSLKALGQTQIENLKCEYQHNPLGIDTSSPRFTWNLMSEQADLVQSGYVLRIGTDSVGSNLVEGIIFESKEILSDRSFSKPTIPELNPFSKYFWQVIVTDNLGGTVASPVANFETGIMQTGWKGMWISDGMDMNYRPAPYFRKTFEAKGEIQSARIYVATAGLHEITLNGHKISEEILNPVFSQLNKRIYYNTYDVTELFKEGQNALGLLLGNGWFNHQVSTVWGFDRAPWRERPKFILNLHLNYTDGTTEVIKSDHSWKTHDSPVTFNSIYLGENYDTSLEIPRWNAIDFDDSPWQNASQASPPQAEISSQMVPPIKVTQIFSPKIIRQVNDNKYLFSFANNISGKVLLEFISPGDQTISIRHGEQLRGSYGVRMGTNDSKYIRLEEDEIFQTDHLKVQAGEQVSFQPVFNYKGFQHVEINTEKPLELTENNVKMQVVHSDIKQIGFFESSDNTLNQIYRAVNNSIRYNTMGYPTDCPHREKNGWTGDAHMVSEAALFSYDMTLLYEKWMQDHRDVQKTSGQVPVIIPSPLEETQSYFDWTSSMVIIPWNVYQFTGDPSILEDNYPNMISFFDYWFDRYKSDPSAIVGYGDWHAPSSKSDRWILSIILLYHDAHILAETSKVLGNKDLAKKYDKIKSGIRGTFLDKISQKGSLTTQTELSMALEYDILPIAHKRSIIESLVKRIEDDNMQPDVGLMGSKSLLPALSKNGYQDLAYQLATKRSTPSWFGLISDGNTFKEGWVQNNSTYYGGSANHAYFGSINQWMMEYLGGLQPDPNSPGFKHFRIKPSYVSDLNFVNVGYQSPEGNIQVHWKRDDETILQYLTIPPNTTADYYLPKDLFLAGMDLPPGAKEPVLDENLQYITLGSGNYRFEFTEKEITETLLITDTQYGVLGLERGNLIYAMGKEKVINGTLVIHDLNGKIVLERQIRSENPKTKLIELSEPGLDHNSVWIFKLTNKYENGTIRTLNKKIVKTGNYYLKNE